MTDFENPSAKPGTIQVIRIRNYLKQKLGIAYDKTEGEIAPQKIAEADKCIHDFAQLAAEKMDEFIALVVHDWDKMKDLDFGEERSKIAQNVFINAHEVHDLAGLCGHDLGAHFAEQLRDYICQSDLSLKAQRVISQALVDALQTVNAQEIKAIDDPRAAELKAMVQKAIDKYG